LLLGVERVEESTGGGQRLSVAAGLFRVDKRGVAHADAEKETIAVCGSQRRVLGGDVGRLVHPEVEDAGGDHHLLGGSQQIFHRVHHRPSDVGNPQGLEPEFLQLGGCLGSLGGVAVPQL
jgi:hypothetical protein